MVPDGHILTRPRSAAVSKTSRSSFAMGGRWKRADAAGPFDALRLVEDDPAAAQCRRVAVWSNQIAGRQCSPIVFAAVIYNH